MPNHIHLLVFIKERSKGLNHVMGELAYEIVSCLKQDGQTELLKVLPQGVQENERKKGKKHQVLY